MFSPAYPVNSFRYARLAYLAFSSSLPTPMNGSYGFRRSVVLNSNPNFSRAVLLAVALLMMTISWVQGAQLAAGYASTFAIDRTGKLFGWGLDRSGQLGIGREMQRLSPRQVAGISNAKQVAIVGSTKFIIKTDGTLWVVGGSGYGLLANNETTRRGIPVQIGSGFDQIAPEGTFGIKSDGTLWAWGLNTYGSLGDGTTTDRAVPVQIGSGYAQVATAGGTTFAIKTDGTLWAWGDNTYGQLGDGTRNRRITPVQIGIGFAKVETKYLSTMAIKTDGTLWGWGYANFGGSTPTQFGSGYVQVKRGGGFYGIKPDGTLWASGYNAFGHLGDGTKIERVVPVRIGDGYAQVSAGQWHTAGIKTDGTLWAWGLNDYGQVGDGTTTLRMTPVQIGSDYAQVVAGDWYTVAIKTDGTLWEWGVNDNDQLDTGIPDDVNVAALIGSGYAQVSADSDRTVAIKTDGTLWEWGVERGAFMGGTRSAYHSLPVQIGSGFVQVSASAGHTVAMKTDGTLWAWGSNSNGGLCDGTYTNRSSPVLIGSGFAQAAAGSEYTIALKTDGTLWACGRNTEGQFSDGTYVNHLAFVQIGSGYAQIMKGVGANFAIKTDGTLWAWGNNRDGQLGDGTTIDRILPVQIGSGYAQVAVGWHHTAALKTDGTLWTWGNNDFGQLGDGTTSNRIKPAQIGSGYAEVAAGPYHSVALKTDGTLWAWGKNDKGQLGNGTYIDQLTPHLVLNSAGSGYFQNDPSLPPIVDAGASGSPVLLRTVVDRDGLSVTLTDPALAGMAGSLYATAYIDSSVVPLIGISPTPGITPVCFLPGNQLARCAAGDMPQALRTGTFATNSKVVLMDYTTYVLFSVYARGNLAVWFVPSGNGFANSQTAAQATALLSRCGIKQGCGTAVVSPSSDWLHPFGTNDVVPLPNVAITAQASGPLSNMTIAANIGASASALANQNGQIYFCSWADSPGTKGTYTRFMQTGPNSWEAMPKGASPPLLNAPATADGTTWPIVSGINMTALKGTIAYLGFAYPGQTCNDVMASPLSVGPYCVITENGCRAP